MRVDYLGLEAFVGIADYGSFHRAADAASVPSRAEPPGPQDRRGSRRASFHSVEPRSVADAHRSGVAARGAPAAQGFAGHL